MMRSLPYDYFRCHPEFIDEKCKVCKRWANQPQQTFGERTPHMINRDSASTGCDFISTKEEHESNKY